MPQTWNIRFALLCCRCLGYIVVWDRWQLSAKDRGPRICAPAARYVAELFHKNPGSQGYNCCHSKGVEDPVRGRGHGGDNLRRTVGLGCPPRYFQWVVVSIVFQ
jgi:hypothetical protein